MRPSPRPDKWNLRATFAVAVVLGAVPLAACLIALWAALDSHSPGSLFSKLGLPGMPYEKVQMLLYMLISIDSFLTLFSARERGPFWSSAPHWMLASASGVSLVITILLASFWPASVLTGIPLLGLARADSVSGYRLWPVWALIYCFLTFLVQDLAKVAAWATVTHFDLFHYRTGPLVGARAAHAFDASPAAAAATGAVEGRLLEFRAKGSARSLERASIAAGGDATLDAAAADMKAAVTSIAAGRRARFQSASAPAADVEAGGADAAVAAWERAAAAAEAAPGLPEDVKGALRAEALGVRRASLALDEVLEAQAEQGGRRGAVASASAPPK